MSMTVTAYKCPNCNFIVYNRCKQDLRNCYCGAIRNDGTIMDESKINGKEIEVKHIEINATSQKLLIDFNYNGTEWGIIKPQKDSK